jgi:haloalkane dehalogenase
MLHQKFVDVLGYRMAYREMGEDAGDGEPTIVFLHGNPTSSYLWRTTMPPLAALGRCIAPDLIGMGDSDKLADSGPGSYRFVEHRRFLDAFFDAVDVGDDVVLVVHDWGSALGFDWANRHRDRVRGIAYMEALVTPVTWNDWPDSARGIFQGLRSAAGEEMVIQKNIFVERILPASVLDAISEEDMTVYRKPYLEPGESRRPTLTWPREIPIEGEPADTHVIVGAYEEWLATTEMPKLFINADPGSILIGPQRDRCRVWPNQTEVTVRGSHFIQEDSGPEIAAAISSWMGDIQE